MATQQAYPRPQAGILYGLTHTADGEQITRLPRTVKVSIGIPGGKDLHVYKRGGKWHIVEAKNVKAFDNGRDAKAHYDQRLPLAPERNFPQKLSYFTFRRNGPEGALEPDWRAIDAHGDLPTVIDIMFTDRQPLEAAYEMWGGGRRKCWGDGHNALRALDLAGNPEEKALAKEAQERGERYFPIVNGCNLHGCPYAKSPDGGKKPAPCKPHARLSFQLVSDLRLGGKAEFNTTSYRSISQLYSSLEELTRIIQGITGADSLAGIPIQFCVRPYTTQHNNKPVKAWGVTLEFRAEALAGLRKKLIGFAQEMNAQLNAPMPVSRQIAASADPVEPTPEEAEALEAEFYPSVEDDPGPDEDDFTEGQPATPSQQAGQATAAKMDDLKAKLEAHKPPAPEAPKETAPEPVAATPAPAPAPPPAVPPEPVKPAALERASTAKKTGFF